MAGASSQCRIAGQARRADWLLRNDSGSTTIEYSVLAALVVSALVVAVSWTGVAMRHSLDRVAFQIDDPAIPNEVAGKPKMPIVRAWPQSWRWSSDVIVALIITAIPVNLGLWYLLARRQRLATSAEPVEAVMEHDCHDVIFDKRQRVMRQMSRHVAELLENRLLVRHLMSTQISSILPTATVAEAVAMMKEHRFRHLLVCDSAGQLVGIVSSRDVRWCPDKRVSQIMTPRPRTIEASAPVSSTTTILLKERISCVPVLADGQLVGVMTTTDLLMAFQCLLQLLHGAHTKHGLTIPTDDHVPKSISEAIAL